MLHRNLVYLATIADSNQNAQNAASVRILIHLPALREYYLKTSRWKTLMFAVLIKALLGFLSVTVLLAHNGRHMFCLVMQNHVSTEVCCVVGRKHIRDALC